MNTLGDSVRRLPSYEPPTAGDSASGSSPSSLETGPKLKQRHSRLAHDANSFTAKEAWHLDVLTHAFSENGNCELPPKLAVLLSLTVGLFTSSVDFD